MVQGQVQYVLAEFPDLPTKSDIVAALVDLVHLRLIHILDIVIVIKDANGEVSAMEIDDLPDDAREQFYDLHGEYDGLVSEVDIVRAAESMSPARYAVILVWENTWSIRLGQAVEAAGGVVLANEPIPLPDFEQAIRSMATSSA